MGFRDTRLITAIFNCLLWKTAYFLSCRGSVDNASLVTLPSIYSDATGVDHERYFLLLLTSTISGTPVGMGSNFSSAGGQSNNASN